MGRAIEGEYSSYGPILPPSNLIFPDITLIVTAGMLYIPWQGHIMYVEDIMEEETFPQFIEYSVVDILMQ